MKCKITYKSTLLGLLLLLKSLLFTLSIQGGFFPNELKDLAREISRKSIEGAAWFLPAAYTAMREDRDELRNKSVSF